MPVLPIPMFVALVLAYLVVFAWLKRDTALVFILLIALCSVQNVLVALNLYYGFGIFQLVQPFTASLIPPLSYLAFILTTQRPISLTQDGWHATGPLLTLFSILWAPLALDFVVPGIFVIYGLVLLVQLARGEDRLVLARLETGNIPLLLWRAFGIALLVSALSDVAIILDQVFYDGRYSLMIVGGFSSIILMAIGSLSLSRALQQEDVREEKEPVEAVPQESEETAYKDLMQRLHSLLEEQKLYLDPSLTLSQLARRLHVPAKQLSAAINQQEDKNVSRYINDYRIRQACEELRAGQSITHAMLNSGFNTKSNFNREFLRVMEASPSEWRKSMRLPVS